MEKIKKADIGKFIIISENELKVRLAEINSKLLGDKEVLKSMMLSGEQLPDYFDITIAQLVDDAKDKFTKDLFDNNDEIDIILIRWNTGGIGIIDFRDRIDDLIIGVDTKIIKTE